MITPIRRIPTLTNNDKQTSQQKTVDMINFVRELDGKPKMTLEEIKKQPLDIPPFLYNAKGKIV